MAHRRSAWVGAFTPPTYLEFGHDIRPVQVVSDAAEALGLALRTVGGPGAVEARELEVGVRADAHLLFKGCVCVDGWIGLCV